jgi:branched-chain amino acid aminotransferase
VLVWINGRLHDDPATAVLPVTDHGFTVGDGVFETLKVTEGRPFALTRHLERLARSAGGLGLELDLDRVRAGIHDVLAGATGSGRLRITVTGGPAPYGSGRGGAEPTVVVVLAPASTWEPATDVVTVPWTRNERGATAGLKTTSYAENVVALAFAHDRGASEAIFADTTGRLCEGTGSNVFVALAGRLLTPSLDTGCLAGVTRALLLEWTSAEEAELPLSVLAEADEVFLSSSTRDVQPVRSVDGRALPGVPGPITTAAAEAFARHAAADTDP